jgi:hypothetical protein
MIRHLLFVLGCFAASVLVGLALGRLFSINPPDREP